MWKNKFVPVGIASCISQCEFDISKWKSYVVYLEANNFENKLHYIVNATGLNDLGCLNSCLYTDIDNIQEYLTIKLISILANYKNSEIPINPASEVLVLIYQNRGYDKPLND